MRTHFYIPWRLLVLWDIAICADGGGEDVGIHAFCAQIAKLGLIILHRLRLFLLLSTDNTKSTEEGDTLSITNVSLIQAKLYIPTSKHMKNVRAYLNKRSLGHY